MANRYMKRRLALLIITEIQVRITMRYHLTPVRMAIIKKSTFINAGEDVEKRQPFLHCGWESKLVQSLWKSVEVPQKTKNRTTI